MSRVAKVTTALIFIAVTVAFLTWQTQRAQNCDTASNHSNRPARVLWVNTDNCEK